MNLGAITAMLKATARSCLAGLGGLMTICAGAPASGQSFDCAKASSATETAICVSEALRAADERLARTFGSAISAADADTAARLRSEQRIWLAERNGCASQGSTINDCLVRTYRSRIAALAGTATTPTVAAALPAGPPPGVATLTRGSVPAVGESSTFLKVDVPGRFSIRASSKTGVALQLVDMIAGPGQIAGDAGSKDGRLDLLLDKGVYKLRTFGAPIADGDVNLTIAPFAATGPADTTLLRGGEKSSVLADGQQTSFWVFVGRNGKLFVDAAGRSLGDLRAWRNGTDLSELMPASASVEPVAGQSLLRLRLEGLVESGLYLVTAYGGEPLAWSNGSATQPLHISVGAPADLPGGGTSATVGPSGTLRFSVPSSANVARIELPDIAPVRMDVVRDGKSIGSATIEKASRETSAAATFAAGDGTVVEVTGRAGQRVSLRTLSFAASARTDAVGPHVATVDVAGDGGDDAPATALLARFDRSLGKGQVVASTSLRVAPGQAWRRKFNLRGPTTLLVEIAGSGPVAARTTGPGVRVLLEPLLGTNAPRADGRRPRQWDVEAGFYTLKLDPIAGAVGVLDLTFGQPDLTVEPTSPAPHRDTIDFGLLTFERGTSHQIFVNTAPGLLTAPHMRALPANLAAGALVIPQTAKSAATPTVAPSPAPTIAPVPPPRPRSDRPPLPAVQKPVTTTRVGPSTNPLPPKPAPVLPPVLFAADKALVIPVRTPPGGTLSVADATGRPIPFTRTLDVIDKNVRSTTLTIPPAEGARTLAIAWLPTVANAPVPPLPREADGARIVAGSSFFFDLAKDERKSFALDVTDGGLYRVETLGRLQTSATIGTRFLPKLASADDNGPGHNALVQTWLRGGTYRVRVDAKDSAGHLGVVARPARLIDGGTIVADGSARATLAEDAGATFVLDIAETGDYRLDLYGIDRTWTARLEDADGWPLAAPGELSTERRRLEKGRYRLVVMPPNVEAAIVVRLRRQRGDAPIEGHGPHPLSFDKTVKAQWREPTNGAARMPDRYEFTLDGMANVTLATSDGMTGDLLSISDAKPLSRIAADKPFQGELAAGRYAIEMRAIGRDDRLDYSLDLTSEELQPDSPRFVELPATIPFVIAQDRVVGLTTYGDTQLTGVLRNERGEPIERLSGRTDDWNIAVSRRLPAGRYTLELAGLETPKASADDASETSDSADDKSGDAPKDDGAATVSEGDDPSAAVGDTDANDRKKIEVRMALPATSAARDLALSGTALAGGKGVSRFTVAVPDAETLLLIAAEANAEVVLSLERNGEVVAFSRGRAPVVAVPVDAATRDGWEVALWPVDGGDTPVTLGARAIAGAAGSATTVTWTQVGTDGPLARWRVGRLASPAKALVSLPARTDGLIVGSTYARALAPFQTGVIAPQSASVWFVAPASALPSRFNVEPPPPDAPVVLTLAGGDTASLPVGVPSGQLRVWRADATDGQPGLLSDRGAAVADGTAIALAGDTPVQLRNAGGDGDLAVRATAVDVRQAAPLEASVAGALFLPPRSAQPLTLPAGTSRLAMQLAPGIAAILSGGDATVAVWGGDRATVRETTGAWKGALLVNTNDEPAPAGLDAVPAQPVSALTAGNALKRFFGAAGALTVPIDAAAGDRLIVAGSPATFVALNGSVLRGTSLVLPGPGSLTLDHPAGLVVAGLSRGDLTPWAVPKSVAMTLPGSRRLEGAAMSLALRADAPMLLRVRTTAPVVFALRKDGAGSPEPMPLGAYVRRYLAAGDAELQLFSPQDGPLTGTLDLSAEPITPVGDGIGAPQVLAPGASAVFAFEVTRPTMIGVGVRAEPDRVVVRLLDANGGLIGDGVSQLRKLEKGRYLLEARAPMDGTALTVRPAVVGLTPRPGGPPADVAAKYLELVGMKAGR